MIVVFGSKVKKNRYDTVKLYLILSEKTSLILGFIGAVINFFARQVGAHLKKSSIQQLCPGLRFVVEN